VVHIWNPMSEDMLEAACSVRWSKQKGSFSLLCVISSCFLWHQ